MCGLCNLLAQDPSSTVTGIEKFNVAPSGIGLYRPEKWGVVKLTLKNPQSRAVDILATSHTIDDPTLQFGRRLWVPAQSRISSWHPIRMPSLSAPDQKFFEIRTLVMSTEGGVETLTKNDIGAMQFDQALIVSAEKPATAVVLPFGMTESFHSPWANSMDFLLTARNERGNTQNYSILKESLLPAGEEALDVLDQLVIGDDRILHDAAGIGAIRRWVVGGGFLWVMADQVSPELLESLLGDEDALTVVDQVSLTHVNIVPAPRTPSTTPFERDLDRPAPFVRVLAQNIEPAFLVDGWPAAFWKSYGDGRILVTTLGANGWMRARQPNDLPPSAGINFQTPFVCGEPMNKLAAEFFRNRPAPAFHIAVAEEQVRQTIGYSIPSRGIILGTLLGFTGMMALGAIWLGRQGRLEWLGVATPLASLVAAGTLLFTGMSSRSQVADATSVVQYVQAVPGSDDIRVTGVTGVFSQGGDTTASLSGTGGGWMMPEMSGMEGMTRRLIWNDIDRWSWENLPQKPGLRTVVTQVSGRAPRPLSAIAGFTAGNLSGQVQLPPGMQPSDAILATAEGRIGLTITEDGQWSAGHDSELGAGQYLSASVLSDEQQRRSRILSDLLHPTRSRQMPTTPMPTIPTLYVWTKPWEAGLSYGKNSPVTGSSLVAIPVNWQPPAAGLEFTLPRPLLTYHEVLGPDGLRPSGFYDSRFQQWSERTGATACWVAFDLPPAILPLSTKRVEVTLKVVGSMGRLEISGFQDGAVRSIKTWENPVGTLTHTIEDGGLVPLDETGRFMFRIDAGVAQDAFALGANSRNRSPEKSPSPGSSPVLPAEVNDIPPTEAPALNLTNYWQFADISARITVVAPTPETATAAAP